MIFFNNLFLFFLKKINPLQHAKIMGVKIGKNCSLIGVKYGSEPYLITIGDNVTLSHVSFITHDGSCRLFRNDYPKFDLISPIKISSNVFIGYKSVILPGTQIPSNIIIGACSLVKGTLVENSVYAGVPAKRIGSTDEWLLKNLPKSTNTALMTSKDKRLALRKLFY